MLKKGKTWYTDFTFRGERIRKSTGLTNKKDAEEWEKIYIKNLRSDASGKEVLETIRTTLVDKSVKIWDVWDIFVSFPRKATPDDKQLKALRGALDDFAKFCKDQYGIEDVVQVDDKHARAYITRLRSEGRWTPVTYKRKRTVIVNSNTTKNLSPRTSNNYLASLNLIFSVLQKTKHVIQNPFEDIEALKLEQADREVYTREELAAIINATRPTYLYPLVICGCLTGLRKSTICELKWEQIDFSAMWIGGRHEKTGAKISIPLSTILGDYLYSLPRGSEYVFPELQEAYQKSPTKISADFKAILDSLGIKNRITLEGRSRQSSTKDIHSLRHTFASMSIENASLSVTQGMLGHLSPKMTERYINHASEEQKRDCINAITIGLIDMPKKDKRAQAFSILQRMTSRQFGRFKSIVLRYLAA